MKYQLTKQKCGWNNNQPTKESKYQETKGQTKMILSDEDPIKVIQRQQCIVLFKPNALKHVQIQVI
jgi:hypothetical protein